MNSQTERKKDPLHGVTLEMMIIALHEAYGWEGLNDRLKVNCFYSNPSVKSCLKFFRATPWARAKLEKIFIEFSR